MKKFYTSKSIIILKIYFLQVNMALGKVTVLNIVS